MQRKTICFMILLLLATLPAHSENAIDFFNLGLQNTTTSKKIKCFSKALELDPYLAEAYENRGMLYFFQEKFDEAIQDFQAYIRFGAPKAETYRMLGMSCLKSGFYERAIDRFTHAINMDSELVSAYANRAEAYRLSGKYEESIRDATISIKMIGDGRIKSDAYRTRAKAFREIGRTDLAVADAKAAWDIDPRVPLWWRYYLKSASPEEMKYCAPFLIIGIGLVLFLGLKFKPPDKDE